LFVDSKMTVLEVFKLFKSLFKKGLFIGTEVDFYPIQRDCMLLKSSHSQLLNNRS